MEDFPTSRYMLELNFVPETGILSSIPPMEKLIMRVRKQVVSMELFHQLLIAHRHLQIHPRQRVMTSNEWKQTIQIISEDNRSRSIELDVTCSTIANCLRNYGISGATLPGNIRGEIELLSVRETREYLHPTTDIRIRYKNCFIDLRSFAWTGGERNVIVRLFKP